MKLSSENQRMWDLVQVERFLLHDLGLITDDELDLLAGDGAAVKRLEDYDAAKAQLELDYVERIALLKAELAEAKALVAGAYLAAAECISKRPRVVGNVETILALTPANAERSLQVYAQERVVEEAVWWSEGYHRANGWPSCPKCDRLAAATARLAELKK